jgi:hypothetical protein
MPPEGRTTDGAGDAARGEARGHPAGPHRGGDLAKARVPVGAAQGPHAASACFLGRPRVTAT